MTEELTTQDETQGTEQQTPASESSQPSGSANGGASTQQPVTGDVRVFTQDEVNHINKRTKEQAETAAIKKLVEGLGLGDVTDIETIVKAKQESDEAAKTELQKATEAKQQAEQSAADAIAKANDKLIRAAFLAEAGKLQAQHPQDAYLLANLSEVKITDDGEVTGVETIVKALVDSGRLATIGKPPPPKMDEGAGGGERESEKTIKLTQEEIAQANKMRVSLEDYQKNKRK